MKLLYSEPAKVPYIELDKDNKLIFSVSTEHPKGFKYLCFSGNNFTRVRVSVRSRRTVKVRDPIHFITDMKFTSLPKEVKKRTGQLSPITLGILKKIFKELAPDDYFPRKNLPKLTKMLDIFEFTEEDGVNDDPTANGDEDE